MYRCTYGHRLLVYFLQIEAGLYRGRLRSLWRQGIPGWGLLGKIDLENFWGFLVAIVISGTKVPSTWFRKQIQGRQHLKVLCLHHCIWCLLEPTYTAPINPYFQIIPFTPSSLSSLLSYLLSNPSFFLSDLSLSPLSLALSLSLSTCLEVIPVYRILH